jgi:hypothetical protein
VAPTDVVDETTVRALVERARDPARATDLAGEEWMPPHEIYRPATEEELAAAERRLGFAIPPAVRQVYGSVANGGFGPGYGLIGIGGGARSDLGRDAVEEYVMFRQPDSEDPEWYWPEKLLPICHWGCAIYSCVDCSDGKATVIRFDPNPIDGDWTKAFAAEGYAFLGWLQAWLRGEELFERGLRDPERVQ